MLITFTGSCCAIYTIILLKSVCRCSQTAGRNSCSIVSGNVYNCLYRLTVYPVPSSRLNSAKLFDTRKTSKTIRVRLSKSSRNFHSDNSATNKLCQRFVRCVLNYCCLSHHILVRPLGLLVCLRQLESVTINRERERETCLFATPRVGLQPYKVRNTKYRINQTGI